jgi:putative methylase
MATKSALETQLAVVAGFENPQIALEQYPTPPELAAHLIHVADLNGDVGDRTVVDLGTGTGMLALGAALRGPARVVGVELDRDALEIARENRRRVGTTTPIHWIQGDATRAPLCLDGETTVVMNPPFGAQNGSEHADRRFLQTAADLADVSYSVHNEGSRDFVESFAADEGGDVTHAFRAELTLDRQFGFHSEDAKSHTVEIFRIVWE